MCEELDSIDWHNELRTLSTENSFVFFLERLGAVIDRYVPSGPVTLEDHWVPKPPASLMRSRASTWIDYKSARRSFGRRSPEALSLLENYKELNHMYLPFPQFERAMSL